MCIYIYILCILICIDTYLSLSIFIYTDTLRFIEDVPIQAFIHLARALTRSLFDTIPRFNAGWLNHVQAPRLTKVWLIAVWKHSHFLWFDMIWLRIPLKNKLFSVLRRIYGCFFNWGISPKNPRVSIKSPWSNGLDLRLPPLKKKHLHGPSEPVPKAQGPSKAPACARMAARAGGAHGVPMAIGLHLQLEPPPSTAVANTQHVVIRVCHCGMKRFADVPPKPDCHHASVKYGHWKSHIYFLVGGLNPSEKY